MLICICALLRAAVDDSRFQFSGRGFPKDSSGNLPFHYHLPQEKRCLWGIFSHVDQVTASVLQFIVPLLVDRCWTTKVWVGKSCFADGFPVALWEVTGEKLDVLSRAGVVCVYIPVGFDGWCVPNPSMFFVHQPNILYYCFNCWQYFIHIFIW